MDWRSSKNAARCSSAYVYSKAGSAEGESIHVLVCKDSFVGREGGLSKLDANECGPEKAREEREEEDHNPDEMKRLLLQAGKEKGEGGRK